MTAASIAFDRLDLSSVQRRRDKAAAVKLMRKPLKKQDSRPMC